VYYVLYDSTNYSAVIPQLAIPTSDTNTDLVAAIQPAGPFEYPSQANDAADSGKCFEFPGQ
jgi:hypothetical protein